ncbi:MAG: hypothetical protein J5850_02535 [Clostridia bacterium]|nr:hypothetical protein [Clostridia bacterium]
MSKFLSKLDNLWYHHKWKIIIISFFVIVLVICVVQTCSREEYDFQLIYAGSLVTRSEQENAVVNAFMTMIPKDGKDHNGFLHTYAVLSDEEIEELKKEAAKEGDSIFYDTSLRNEAINEINTLIRTGEVSICIISPYVYDVLSMTGKFVPLTDIIGYRPDSAYDDYAVYLKKTGFGSYFSAFENMPEDTLICIFADSFMAESLASKRVRASYEFSLETFKNVLLFERGN